MHMTLDKAPALHICNLGGSILDVNRKAYKDNTVHAAEV